MSSPPRTTSRLFLSLHPPPEHTKSNPIPIISKIEPPPPSATPPPRSAPPLYLSAREALDSEYKGYTCTELCAGGSEFGRRSEPESEISTTEAPPPSSNPALARRLAAPTSSTSSLIRSTDELHLGLHLTDAAAELQFRLLRCRSPTSLHRHRRAPIPNPNARAQPPLPLLTSLSLPSREKSSREGRMRSCPPSTEALTISLFTLLSLISGAVAAGSIGVNYGRIVNNLPSATTVGLQPSNVIVGTSDVHQLGANI